MKTRIFLTGFRGSGKTTLAKLLAEKLNFETIEMDEMIVKGANKTIAELTQNGHDWRSFRRLEQETLKKIIQKEKIVVACGGGLFVNEILGKENYDLVKKISNKIIIFLKTNEKVLKNRLGKTEFKEYNKNWRPFLSGKKESDTASKSTADFKHYLEENLKIYRQRLPLYEKQANTVIDNSYQTPEETVKEILKIL